MSSTDLPPAPSTKDAVHPSKNIGRPAASDAASGAAVSGSAAKMRTSSRPLPRTAAAMPDSSPPPPSGATMASTSGRSSRISRPTVPLPAMKRSSSNGWTKCPFIRSDPCAITVLPALVVARAHDRRAQPLDGVHLGRRRRVHHHHRAGRADLARGQRHALRRVAGADRPDAVLQFVRRELPDRVVGAADLEGADRLQHLELQVQLANAAPGVELDANERRANGRLVDGPRSVEQVRQGECDGWAPRWTRPAILAAVAEGVNDAGPRRAPSSTMRRRRVQ